MKALLTQFGYDPSEYRVDQPARVGVTHMFYWGYKKDALAGGINMDFGQTLYGIPLMTHIEWAVNMGDSYTDGGLCDTEYYVFLKTTIMRTALIPASETVVRNPLVRRANTRVFSAGTT